MKKSIAFALALMLVFLMAAVPTFAASTSIVGKLVDSDGEIASDGYDAIRPGSDYYYVIAKSGTGYDSYVDEDLIRFSLKKKEGRKYISDADLVEKKFDSARYICIRFSVKDNFSADEYKVVMEANFRAKKDLVITNGSSYNKGDAFPAFRPATSSDGSYTPEQIQSSRANFNEAVTERDELNKKIPALLTEIANLENQIKAEGVQDQQKQAEIDAANKELENAQNELSRLNEQAKTAQQTYDAAKAALEAAQKAKDEEASKAAAQEEAAQNAQKTAEAELQNAQNDWNTANEDLTKANADLTAANTALSDAQALKAALGPQVFTQDNPKPTDFTSVTLVDRFNATNQDASLITTWNNSLANYTEKTFTQLATDDSNNQAVSDELNAEIKRVDQLIADANADIADANDRITKAEARKADAQQRIDLANQALANQPMPVNPAPAPQPITNTDLQAAADAEKDATDKLKAANSAVTAQTAVVTTAEQKLKNLETNASGTDDLKKQLEAKKTELATQQDKLKETVKLVESTKADLDRKLEGSGDNVLKSGETFTYTFRVYIQNENITDDDATFTAGEKGVVVKPVKNEVNTVTWEDGNRTLAVLSFRADSDVSFYCPRLSTRWNYSDYNDYFDDMDAYLFNFVDSPTIPATTRPVLSLYNPFVDDDGDLTVRTSRIHIYEVDDGELRDVTDDFRFEKNDDDDYVMTIKTRTLGTYIVSDGKAKIAERPSIEAGDDYDRGSSGNSGGTNSGGGNSVVNNKKPVPWTGR